MFSNKVNMKIKKIVLIVLLAVSATAACTINMEQPNENANTNAQISPVSTPVDALKTETRWSVVVCSSRAKNVTLSAGPSENDSEVFAIWKQDAPQKKFDLPARVQNLSSVYFMGSASDSSQVELCVLFDGKPKKRVEFDDSEDQIINSTDADDEECRCAG